MAFAMRTRAGSQLWAKMLPPDLNDRDALNRRARA
jgi:hypothetical protein